MTNVAMTETTARSLAMDLTRLGVLPGMSLLVHGSLKRLGWVEGGAQAVIDGLLEAVGPAGTLLVPTHTGHLTDPEFWTNPAVPQELWEPMRAQLPPFEPALTASWGMGAIPEALRQRAGSLRSGHPLHSFAALGPRARELLGPHPLDRGLGEGSPLARLEAADARVLLLGVDHSVNTSLHLAEYRARWPGWAVLHSRAPLLVDGLKRWVTFEELDHRSEDFQALGEAWRASSDALGPGRVGDAQAELVPLRQLLAFAVSWLSSHRTGG
jgi:aminoglycoside 3-N-acetyltransferase